MKFKCPERRTLRGAAKASREGACPLWPSLRRLPARHDFSSSPLPVLLLFFVFLSATCRSSDGEPPHIHVSRDRDRKHRDGERKTRRTDGERARKGKGRAETEAYGSPEQRLFPSTETYSPSDTGGAFDSPVSYPPHGRSCASSL